ncbi:hypothetical protein BSLG_009394 [Batrachochytrium salamandrivorans]|nr:hypothetical protein BSLG_009394 [Batrachochytrium salamandrivorans]
MKVINIIVVSGLAVLHGVTADPTSTCQVFVKSIKSDGSSGDNYNTCKAEYIKLKNLEEDEERKGIKGKDSELPTRRHIRTVSTKLQNAENERDRYIGAIRNVELASAILIRDLGENGDRKFSEWVA